MYAKHTIGVVVPALNEENLIADTIRSIPSYVDRIYVIDDGSTDRTLEIVADCARRDGRIIPIKHERNRGVGAAIVSGYKQCLQDRIDIAAVLAGDNQMDTKYLPRILDPIVWGVADYTKGNRLYTSDLKKGMSAWRSLGNYTLTFLTKMASGYWYVMDPQNGYTAISKQSLMGLDLDFIYPGYGYCNDLLVHLNVNNSRVVDVVHPARYGKEQSKIRYGKYMVRLSKLLLRDFIWRINTKYAMRGFHPLVLFYIFGIALSLFGAGGLVYAAIYKIFLEGEFFVRGILSLVVFIIGLQFLFFAMIFDMQQKSRGHTNLYLGDLEFRYEANGKGYHPVNGNGQGNGNGNGNRKWKV